MEKLAKLALSFGNKSVSVITLLIICIAVIIGLWMTDELSNQKRQEQDQTQQKQIANILHSYTVNQVEKLNSQLSSIATSEHLRDVLSSADSQLIDKEQKQIQSYFPNARHACLISPNVDDVVEHACMPITFATLNSLRQAKKNGVAQIGVLQQGTDDAHILLAHKITDQAERLLGVLVITINLTQLPDFIFKPSDFNGFVELQQGSKSSVVLASYGDVQLKQGSAKFVKGIPSSHWQLAYWSEEASHNMTSLMIIAGVVLAIILLMWTIIEFVKDSIFKRDVATLRAELADFKSGSLKANYFVALAPLVPVVSDILALARESYRNTSKQGATAESLEKKIEHVIKLKESDSEEVLQEVATIDPLIFKGSDIRGIMGDNIDESVFKTLGHAIGSEAGERGISRLVVGRDARLSSDSLTHALIEGIQASGCDVLDVGLVPTPLMYFACEQLGTQSGVMVTASHNAKEYNGLKIVLAGESLAQEELIKLHQRAEQGNFRSGDGSYSEVEIIGDYVNRVVDDINVSRGIKVVVDCSNGIAGTVVPIILETLGCEVIKLFCEVDGNFPNHEPDPSRPENLRELSKAVQEHNAELGLAFDGDGDRLAVVDAEGTAILPDRLLMLFAHDILSRHPGSVVIYDVKCSSLLGEEVANAGGEAMMCETGHSSIKNKMKEYAAPLAGELSGHLFIGERWYGFDDALYAACRLLELISEDLMQRTATEIFTALPSRVSTPEILVEMDDGESIPFMMQLSGEGDFVGAELITIDGVRAEYMNGWGLVRASKTGSGLTLRFEADSEDELQTIQQRFKEQMLQIKPTLQLLF